MSLTDKMNEYLANQMVMYIKLHNMHWYIKGQSFFTLHAKLEELYDQTAQMIDEIAERILALEASPVASMKNALAITQVKEFSDKPISSEEAIHGLLTDVDYWINDTRDIVKLAEKEQDLGTADLFTGYLSEYQKLMWMLKAYMTT